MHAVLFDKLAQSGQNRTSFSCRIHFLDKFRCGLNIVVANMVMPGAELSTSYARRSSKSIMIFMT